MLYHNTIFCCFKFQNSVTSKSAKNESYNGTGKTLSVTKLLNRSAFVIVKMSRLTYHINLWLLGSCVLWKSKILMGRGRPQFWNFNISSGAIHFLFYATFWFDAPWEPQRYRPDPGGWQLKVKIMVFFRRDPHQNQIIRTFCFIEIFDLTQPWGTMGVSKAPKGVRF